MSGFHRLPCNQPLNVVYRHVLPWTFPRCHPPFLTEDRGDFILASVEKNVSGRIGLLSA